MILFIILAESFLVYVTGQSAITGKVTDAQTHEPLAFANVLFKGTNTATITDFNGNFSIPRNKKSDTLIVILIGYEKKELKIMGDTSLTIDVLLTPLTYEVAEIIVTPGENPAHVLLRNVWKNNKLNNIEKLSSYQYENYSRSTIFLRKFNYKADDERLFKPFSKEFDEYAVTTGEEGIPAIPAYTTEALSDVYFLKSPKREFTRIKAVHSEGIAFDNTDLVSQLANKQENFYFPDNTIQLVDKSFISPLSRYGLLYYKYYITDSLSLDNKYFCYEVRVVPKREEDPVFHGTIWIHDTTYALKRISVEVGKKAELNFIQRIKIQQDYEPVDSGAWFPVKTRFMADAANIFVNNYSERTKFIVNKPVDPRLYNSELTISYTAQDHGPEFWKSNRMGSYDRIDSLALQRIDTLKKIGKLSITARIVETSIKGYYNFGRFEGGPYLMIYNYNNVEGSRIRLGGRTNISFSKKWILEGYLAYGTRDNQLKGSLQSEYFLSKEKWTKAGIQFRDDIENVGSLDEFYSQSSFLTFATSFGGSDKMARSKVVRTWVESDLLRGTQGRIAFTFKTFDPVSPDFYFAYFTDDSKLNLTDHYQTSELSFTLRYQPKATYVLDGIRRFPVNFNKFPVLSLEYFAGLKDIFRGDFSYQKITADLHHNFNPGGIGTLVYDVRFTKVFNPLPYPLLYTLAGNQSFFWINRTYNLMNYGEFILDEALELFLSYHMDGFILGRIPLLKKLQWRSVITGKAAFGSFDKKKNGFYDPYLNPLGILAQTDANGNPVTPFNSLTYTKPYAELSYGIENIFRFFRIDLVHRLTYLDHPNTHQFALKISGVFRF